MPAPTSMFIWPGVFEGFGTHGKGFGGSAINHGLACLSAVLKKNGYPCFLVDMRSCNSWEHFEQVIKVQKFDVVMIGFLSVDESYADKAIRIIKKLFPDKPIIAGGVHLTFNGIKEFSVVDTIVWGEGDEVILDLVKKVELREILPKHIVSSVVKNLDSLPVVDRALFNQGCEKNNPMMPLLPPSFYTINFSRGCSFSCSFCLESKNLLWKGQRLRNPESCVDEIAEILRGEKDGLGSLMIHDDSFPPKRTWAERFISSWDERLPRIPWWCQMRADFICKNEDLISHLSRLGMTWCSIGIEGSQRMLDFYNKKETTEEIVRACDILHENQINIFGNYIMGAPTETKQDIEELCTIVKRIRPEQHSASTYTAYPGSLLYDFCIENNYFVGDGTKESDHYSMARHPYERKIVGVDYDYIRQKQNELSSNYTGALIRYDPRKNTSSKSKAKAIPLDINSSIDLDGKPKVSIIMLSHNRPQFLPQAINSVLAQTIKNWELIIVDDYSTEPEVQGILEQAVKDKRIRAFKTNFDVDNISLLWNRALDNAAGEYIALLDDDNRKKPSFCQEMSKYLDEHQEVDAVACFNAPFRSGDPLIESGDAIWDGPRHMTKANILEGNKVDSGTMMFRKSVVNKIGWFDERLRTEDDWDFVMRIVHNAKGFGVVPKPLAEYRWHADNRVYHSTELGFYPTHDFIMKEKIPRIGKKVCLVLLHPDTDRITLSQNNVLRGICNAMNKISWADFSPCPMSKINHLANDYDIIIVFMSFHFSLEKMEIAKSKGRSLVTYQCEDPHTLKDNLERAKFADYVFTNDISIKADYEKVVGRGRCGFCPSISLDSIGLEFRDSAEKKHEVIFFGHAYDSRVELVRQLIPKLKKGQLKIVGGGWENKGFSGVYCFGEVPEQEALRIMEESKIVVLFNRRKTDLGGNITALAPQSVVRGYFEIASGSLILLDDERKHHSLNDEVIHYSDVEDLVSKIKFYLSHEKEREEIAKRAKESALTNFTYEKRIHDLVNKVRSMRYDILIR
jgi:radical SAM superfamily enzyme YgiQ (UPF0313 family)/glycosyltransferase involved in cell wall biosynthesis